MPATTYVGAEIDQEIRDAAAKVLDSTGLSLSEFIRLTMAKIARDKCLPFDAREALEEEYGDEIPNAETLRAFEDIDNRKNLHYAKDSADMFRQLGI